MLPTTPASMHVDDLQLSPALRRVLALRAGRIAFSVTLLIGFVLMLERAAMFVGERNAPTAFVATIGVVWLSALAMWLVTIGIARASLRLPRDRNAWRKPSLVLPMVAAALVVPPTLHLVFNLGHDRAAFEWFAMSTAMVPHAYIAAAWMSGRRAARIADGEAAMPVRGIFFIVSAIGAIPWVLSGVVVAVTGLPFLWILGWPERALARERDALSEGARVRTPIGVRAE
jgi:hypothetical protein